MKCLWAFLFVAALCGGAEGARHRPYSPTASSTPRPAPSSVENCTQLVQLTEGPYWVDENIGASDLRSNLRYGVPLNLTLKIANGTLSALLGECVPIHHARVDIWHARYDGRYSDTMPDGTVGQKWLRAYQLTNSTGHVTFYTIFPGWYGGRTTHIHVRVRINAINSNIILYDNTTQLYFGDNVSNAIFSDVYPYNSRGLRDAFNSNDSLFESANVLNLTGSYNNADGYSSVAELSLPFASF